MGSFRWTRRVQRRLTDRLKLGKYPINTKNQVWIPFIALSELCYWAVQHTRKPHPRWHHGMMTSLSHSPQNFGFPIKIYYPQTGGTVQPTRCVTAVPGYNATSALTADMQVSRDTANSLEIICCIIQWHKPFLTIQIIMRFFLPIPASYPLLTHLSHLGQRCAAPG